MMDDRELAVLYSDSEGRLMYEETIYGVGKTLVCRVEKSGYEERTMTRLLDQDEISLQFDLTPQPEKAVAKEALIPEKGTTSKTEMKIRLLLTDQNGRPVPSVNVTCEVLGFKVSRGVSTSDGVIDLSLRPE
jgi:hypothetical protein